MSPGIQAEILERYEKRLDAHPNPSDELITQWIVEDFQNERTFTVNDWLLAETEIAHSLYSSTVL